jgi:hypothetical protein
MAASASAIESWEHRPKRKRESTVLDGILETKEF